MILELTQKQQRALFPLTKKRIIVLGAGREGWSTYQFLRAVFPRKVIAVADAQELKNWSAEFQNAINNDQKLRFYSGKSYVDCLDQYDLVFKSPGISKEIEPLNTLLEKKQIELTSNTAWFLKLNKGITVGVTGTKGKSTTSSLIYHVLSNNNVKSVLIGNIGVPPLSMLGEITSKTVVVMEMSAHQLCDLKASPHIAIIHDITREHLDFFHTMDKYVWAKGPICAYQKKNDFVIYNPNFANPSKLAAVSPAKHIHFAAKDAPGISAYADNKTVFYKEQNGLVESVVNLRQVKLRGAHNIQNILPTVIVAKHFKLTGEQINNAIKTFSPLKHRLEWVGKVNEVDYYNDSLATTPESVMAAMRTFMNRKIILLAGGLERHQDYTDLAEMIARRKLPAIILFPTTGQRLADNIISASKKLEVRPPVFYHVESMQEAIDAAAKIAKPDTVVLLSPGAASFNTFIDYADRGNQFATQVKNLI
ncbi:MAG: UDP-N-acetylmuramoyl-L-alanine--D-glutamate ligase [Pseudomonadales bacterium]|jgi:UDP-N-acetylmuramoylalanine--D-glutamate ligase|nr:UDP-N-acetylmuramoyl-L-alanine--D-glutamate ligase [Pseudomonadales bacterium]